MKNKFVNSLILIIVIKGFSIYLSGCMMAGMGMMHGDGSHGMNKENLNMSKYVIKEYRTNKYVITAEFLSIVSNSTDFCKLKVFNTNSNSLVTDVDAYLYELAENANEQKEHPGNNSTYKIRASRIEDGYLVFSHDLSGRQNYQLLFSIKRIEDDTFEPPIEIQTQINDQIELNNNLSHHSNNNTST